MDAPEKLDGESALHYMERTSVNVFQSTYSIHDAIYEYLFGVYPLLLDWIFIIPPFISFDNGGKKIIAPSYLHIAQYFPPEFFVFL